MSSTSKRIVLVDPLGDVLFSGESMISMEAANFEEPCPETKRSAESGMFRAVRRSDRPEDSVTEALPVSEEASDDSGVATQKRGGRAA